jgi:ubiquinol-cytochrome c reductase cytochrome c subunit
VLRFSFATLGYIALMFTLATAQTPVEKGRAVFLKQNCFRCHGTQGQGTAGPRLAPNPPSTETLIKYVRKPAGAMPAYCEKCVSDAELTDIRAYLASIPAPPPLKDIPLLNQ